MPDHCRQQAEAHCERLRVEIVVAAEAPEERDDPRREGDQKGGEQRESDQSQVGEDLDVGVVDRRWRDVREKGRPGSGNWRRTSFAISRSPITSGAVLWRQPTPTIGLRSKISMPAAATTRRWVADRSSKSSEPGICSGRNTWIEGEDEDRREAHRQRDASRPAEPRCRLAPGSARTAPTATVTPAATNDATDLASTRPKTAIAASG